jgi:hypothetical protein
MWGDLVNLNFKAFNRDYPLNCVNEDLLLHFINHFPGQR